MPRTRLTPQRQSQIRRTNIGRIIVFCEGKTEEFYFQYFAEIIKKNKFTNIEIVLEDAGGNAQAVLNFANSFLSTEENMRKYSNFGMYLAFDCDSPDGIESVIHSANDYELLVSNSLFETWLLMHFEDVEVKQSKRDTYRRLTYHLNSLYKKGHKGKTREIIQNGDVLKALDNAKRLEAKYISEGKTMSLKIKSMNPYTSVFRLIEQFILEMSV